MLTRMNMESMIVGVLIGVVIVLLALNLFRSVPVKTVVQTEEVPVVVYDRPYWGYWGPWGWGGYGSGGYSGGIWTGGGGHHGGGGGGHGGGGHGGH